MKLLLYKELRLAAHPLIYFFWLLSAMLLIPSYPYYVVFFYTTLGLFFVCLTGRENHDVEYTLSLPVRRRDAVAARFLFALAVEGVQLILAVLAALLRRWLALPDNAAGLEANIAFFGLSLFLLGMFHLIFFPRYYKAPDKVGRAFAVASAALFLLIVALECCAHILPFFRDKLDTRDPQFLSEKLAVLAAGLILYLLLTLAAYHRSCRRFEALDL